LTFFEDREKRPSEFRTKFLRNKSIVQNFLSAKRQINYGLVMISCALVWLVSLACADFCGRRGILSIFEKGLASCNVVASIFVFFSASFATLREVNLLTPAK